MTFTPTDYLPYDFANRRHIGPSPAEMEEMLTVVGAKDLDALIDETLPQKIRQTEPLDFGKAMSERELLFHMRVTASKNKVLTSLIGQGYHGTVTPPAIQRNILENPAWYTAYTPYQPEISQGRLEALLNFQTMVTDLTGLEIANASLLDEATACAEAMTMAQRVAKSKAKAFFVDRDCHPQNIAVMQTRAKPLGIEVIIGAPEDLDASAVFGAIFQYPGTYGDLADFTPQMEALHAAKALAVVAADPLALTLLKEPAAMGADIAVGSAQRFGVPMGYGGPHAGFMATRDGFKRNMPGRIVGVSIDARGNRAYRLSLQTREQHIRREKATSNICTAQALLAVMASMYAVFHGPEGLKAIAQRVHLKAVRMAEGLEKLRFTVGPDAFFDTILVTVGALQGVIIRAAAAEGVNLRAVDGDKIASTLDELVRDADIDAVLRAFGGAPVSGPAPAPRLPEALSRQTDYLTHPVFHMNRAEAEMTRYMRRLADRDLALDRAMIPLGSCTMKLNATAEMLAITWPEFSNIHPQAPIEQRAGYAELVKDLSEKLCDATGYDAMSMQPNSGAQGEYAGLLTIRAYHKANGEGARDVCLIPTSAHGTNPASAQMVGWKVVPVKARENGDIDVDDFRAQAEKHAGRVAACMITYPSTHGVFEETVREVCKITHEAGGQVYMDGANMNAQVGLCRPGDIGADVCHLNLHKTFCIPHGGGGPGMGPIGVAEHLEPFLPGHALDADSMSHERGTPGASDDHTRQVSAAAFGSPSILPISWMYIALMGGEGLTHATKVAILSANYMAKRLEDHYPILFSGENGRCAHEFVIDCRPFKKSAGIEIDDIAKRLVDFGFHAPTMSWPVPGTLMIEPTESEPKATLDEFCDALIQIAGEIGKVEAGDWPAEDNPLKNAPHTIAAISDDDWNRPYPRSLGGFPNERTRKGKFWPSVARVDNPFGDRNLACTCPSVEELAE